MEPTIARSPQSGSVSLPADPVAQNTQNPWLAQVAYNSTALQNFRNFLIGSSAEYPEIKDRHLEVSAQSGDGNFVVHARDQRTAQRIADEAPKIWKQLSESLFGGNAPGHADPIHICAAQGDGLRSRGNSVVNYRDGATCKGILAIGNESDILHCTLPHEMTHAMLGLGQKHDTKPWANEGLAMLSEDGARQSLYYKKLGPLIRGHQTLSPEALFRADHGGANADTVYLQGFSYSEYLVARGEQIERREHDGERLTGKQRLLKFAERVSGADVTPEKINGALSELYGFKSTADLNRNWELWLTSGRSKHPTLVLLTIDTAAGTSSMYDPSAPAVKLPPAKSSARP